MYVYFFYDFPLDIILQAKSLTFLRIRRTRITPGPAKPATTNEYTYQANGLLSAANKAYFRPRNRCPD